MVIIMEVRKDRSNGNIQQSICKRWKEQKLMFGIFKMRESQIALRLSVCLFKWLAFPPQKSCTFVSFFVFQVGKEMCMPGIASEQDQNICVSMKLDSTTTGGISRQPGGTGRNSNSTWCRTSWPFAQLQTAMAANQPHLHQVAVVNINWPCHYSLPKRKEGHFLPLLLSYFEKHGCPQEGA